MTDVSISRIPPSILKRMFEKHTAKRTANALGVALETARKYLIDGVPRYKRLEMAVALDNRITELERDMQALRQMKQQIEGGNE